MGACCVGIHIASLGSALQGFGDGTVVRAVVEAVCRGEFGSCLERF